MALIIADWTKETTTTTGTGTLALNGAVPGFQSFVSGVGNGNQTVYGILASDGISRETGVGTVTAGSPNTLSRDIIHSSTNGGNALSLPSGTHTVYCDNDAYILNRPGLFARVRSAVPTIASTGLSTTMGTGAAVANYADGVVITGSGGCVARTSSVPATPYSILAIMAASGAAANSCYPSLGWTDGTAFQFIGLGTTSGGTGAIGGSVYVQTDTNMTTFGSTQAIISSNVGIMPALCAFKIYNDGTTIYFYFGADGAHWQLLYSVALSSGTLTSYPYIFAGALGGSGSQAVSVWSWIQGTS
jgi:hypothetical protein